MALCLYIREQGYEKYITQLIILTYDFWIVKDFLSNKLFFTKTSISKKHTYLISFIFVILHKLLFYFAKQDILIAQTHLRTIKKGAHLKWTLHYMQTI